MEFRPAVLVLRPTHFAPLRTATIFVCGSLRVPLRKLRPKYKEGRMAGTRGYGHS